MPDQIQRVMWRVLWLAGILQIGGLMGIQAQEQWGLRLGASSGVNGWMLNPAGGLNSPYNIDVTLFSGHAFLETNYAFLRNSSFLNLGLRAGSSDWVASFNYDEEPQAYADPIIFDFVDDARKSYLYGSQEVLGPSAMFRLPGGHTLGWMLRGRAVQSGQGVPNNLSYFKYDRRPDLDPFPVQPWEMAILAWGEVGLHYGRQWETYSGTFNMGLVAKYLMGWEGFYFQNNTGLNAYTKITGDTIAAERMDLSYGYTRSNLGAPPFQLSGNGAGFGFDLGFEWTQDGPFDPYQWKLGVSLLDIGAIRFSRNAVQHDAASDKPVVLPNGDYDFVQSPEDLDAMVRLFSFQTLGDSLASESGQQFILWMPSALSLQFEYGFTESFWVHGALVQRIPHPGIAVQRGNVLMAAARFEKRWFAAGVPVSLYNMDQLRLGLFLRVGPLTLGTDHFPAFIIPGRLSGGDFYCSLRWPFNLSGGRSFSGSAYKLKKGNVKCPTF
jgi:hypothetical protein